MKITISATFVASALWLLTSAQAVSASPQWACLESSLDDQFAVQFDLQDQITEMVSEAQPELTEFATLSASVAKQNLEMTQELYAWIWETDPSRLDTFEAFKNFSWNDADRAAWVADNPNAAAMQDGLDDLNEQVSTHADQNSFYTFLSLDAQQTAFHQLIEVAGQRADTAMNSAADCY